MTSMTREQWLNAFAQAARPVFEQAGATLPDKIRMSVGYTSHGARGKAIGECWTDRCSADETFEIFIVPTYDDSARIADILTHELVHAAVGIEAGHGPKFRKVAVAVGLEGKMTATVAGDAWHAWADPILEQLGPIPHASLTGGTTTQKKQTTRLLKCECDACGFVFRASSSWALSCEMRCPDPDCDGDVAVAS